MKLSIIIPFYNLQKYTDELLDCLAPQINKDIEVIVVDDGSKEPFKTNYDWVRVIRQENGGVSKARNTGLDNAKGDYIQFIDADDLVSDTYVKDVFSEMPFDYLEMSWKTLPGGAQWNYKLTSRNEHLKNPSACTRTFNKAFIGDLRFNENKRGAEDEEFTRKLHLERGKRGVILNYTYFYRTSVENSSSKKYNNGELKTKKIVYHYNHVTKDMRHLIDEFKKEDEHNEVILMTKQCDIPELKEYARVMNPEPIWAWELRGEPYSGFRKIEAPLNADIAIYTSKVREVSGIGTFIYNFCKLMSDKHSIMVLYDNMEKKQIGRILPFARVVQNKIGQKVTCKTLIMNSVFDSIPKNIDYEQSIQMIHACSDAATAKIPYDRDRIIYVSDVAKQSWGRDGEVVRNMIAPENYMSPLLLITASRFDSPEKGQKRMVRLANLMNSKGIPFVWLYFSSEVISNCPPNLIKMPPTTDIRGYIRKADYLVQLSDTEGFCYSVVEALEEGVPIITTPLPVLKELGVNEKNSHTVPFNIPDDFDVEKIFMERKRGFKYAYDNGSLVKKWERIVSTIPPLEYVNVEITKPYHDVRLGREVKVGEKITMEKRRAVQIMTADYCKII